MAAVLIICVPNDRHSFAVSEALRRRGAEVFLWYPGDFPTRSCETFRFHDGIMETQILGPEVEISNLQIDTVWNRRLSASSDFRGLHPSDIPFAEKERQRFREGSLRAAFSSAYWVNPWAAAKDSENKLYQQAVAQRLGLLTPKSLFTNDAREIRAFLREQGGRIIYKTLASSGWSDGKASWACHTVALTEDQLVDDHLLTSVPGIYQELVPKDYELRITMVGDRPFAAKIYSQATETGKIDWRRAYGELQMEPAEIAPQLIDQCIALMRSLGLVFGCFDFVVTPEGRTVFLEVNQMGQFLFIEQYTQLPILDAFVTFLLQRSPDFVWSETSSSLRYAEFQQYASDLAEQSKGLHEVASPALATEKPLLHSGDP